MGSITVAATFTGICCYFSCCILFAIYKRKCYYLFLYGCTEKHIQKYFSLVTEKIKKIYLQKEKRNVEVQKIEIYILVFPNDCIFLLKKVYTNTLEYTHMT